MPLTNIIFDESYFQGTNSPRPQPAGYSNYSEPGYRDSSVHANHLAAKAKSLGTDLTSRKVLVMGCAYGFTIKHLVLLGVDAFGMDISSFAIRQAPLEIASRLIEGDARDEKCLLRAKDLAGLTKPDDIFDLILDENMISCLTDKEAITFSTFARNHSRMFYHLVDQSPHLSKWYNFHTISDWKTIIGIFPNERWFSRFTWEEI